MSLNFHSWARNHKIAHGRDLRKVLLNSWEGVYFDIKEKEIGIPCIYGLDQNHDTTYTLGGILFPQNINVGASFNPGMAEQAASVTAYETRAGDCPWTCSPNVDLTRDPGYGKSCTTFEYSNLKASHGSYTPEDKITVTVDVANTGAVEGKEAVLLFSGDLVASLVSDNRRLRAFDKISLRPGEKKTVTFTLTARDLAFVNAQGEFILQAGTETVKIHNTQTKRL